jgi:hypothetical protein
MEKELVEDREFAVSWETHRLFLALDHDGAGTVSSQFILKFLERSGILRTYKRLAGMAAHLEKLGGLHEDH